MSGDKPGIQWMINYTNNQNQQYIQYGSNKTPTKSNNIGRKNHHHSLYSFSAEGRGMKLFKATPSMDASAVQGLYMQVSVQGS
jgi:hypothetical protein